MARTGCQLAQLFDTVVKLLHKKKSSQVPILVRQGQRFRSAHSVRYRTDLRKNRFEAHFLGCWDAGGWSSLAMNRGLCQSYGDLQPPRLLCDFRGRSATSTAAQAEHNHEMCIRQ